MTNNNENQHNRGQSDGARDAYNPPHEKITDVVRHIISGESRGERECRDAYDAGHKNGSR